MTVWRYRNEAIIIIIIIAELVHGNVLLCIILDVADIDWKMYTEL